MVVVVMVVVKVTGGRRRWGCRRGGGFGRPNPDLAPSNRRNRCSPSSVAPAELGPVVLEELRVLRLRAGRANKHNIYKRGACSTILVR